MSTASIARTTDPVSFARRWVDPGAEERDLAGLECPREMMRAAWAEGLFGLALPFALGGSGADRATWGRVLERLGHAGSDVCFPTLLSARVWLTEALFRWAPDTLVERYVRPMARADLLGAFAYSDGADPFDFSTSLTPEGDTVVIDGLKEIVTGASEADLFLVFAAHAGTGAMAAVIVQRDDSGVQVEQVQTMGMRGLGLCRVRLDRVRVPAWRVVTATDGLTLAQEMLDARRPLLVAPLVGAMQALHEYCVDRLRTTTRYGVPLSEIPSVQATLGRQLIAVESSRAILYRALEAPTGDTTFDPIVSAAKYEISRHGLDVGVSALRLLGGHGYLRGRAERFVRDVCALLAAGGAQDVIEVNLGAIAVAGRPRS